MARFVDLEVEEGGDDAQDPSSRFVAVPPPPGAGVDDSAVTTTPTVCNAVTRAFQCYPIVVGVVSHIDLTTLDALARASRLIHIGLVQYRAALVAATLRCANEHLAVDPDATLRFRVARAEVAGSSSKTSRGLAASTLRERHRRLCAPCAKAPLERVACPGLDMGLPGSADAMRRSLCDCESGGVWLCQPCGRDIRNADHDYLRIWRWRNHYGEVLGCLGTGIGDADRGVICGREERCLAAREREQEVDCDAEDARSSSSSSRTPSTASEHQPATPPGGTTTGGSYFPTVFSGTPPDPNSIEALVAEYARTPSPPLSLGPGYARHEIEGIGGVVKRKLVRMVRVGRCVPEWEEERASVARVLGREARGEARSWCGWCWRVVPGRRDLLPGGDGAGDGGSSLPVRPTQTQSRPPLMPVRARA
ncbi:hypothetical protein ISF_07416 [Cordyceps fumosorosea ARSEF 2679]|uniref:Uncharacterized protein n=1 Tax=Cordyceps fumosorosea (strain ARSEF 2679) TaxID=1081104 RepID=A0A167PPV1_CORFA|nr:hypothetical protein ISF_07416 [Cordyceps fumosorosea ARSEF 2679]OAA56900.1 hypothetical protein ISF_07416 [Cordyceps fumosorosea ARSEF 2679]